MNITVNELRERLTRHELIQLIDVREVLEFHTFNIGGDNIPLGKLLTEVEDLEYDKRQELVLICQRGLRSETARRLLTSQGYLNARNLTGGLLAWRRGQL